MPVSASIRRDGGHLVFGGRRIRPGQLRARNLPRCGLGRCHDRAVEISTQGYTTYWPSETLEKPLWAQCGQ
jgi:hypothetical protein